MTMPDDDRVPLGDGWVVWRDVLLRSAGFPFDDLRDVSEPGLGHDATDEQWHATVAAQAARAVRHLTSERARLALRWQNPRVADLVVGWLAGNDDTARTSRRRRSEHTLAKYLQRYHAKNESVGFFGPVRWTRLDDAEVGTSCRPGERVDRGLQVYLEDWAVEALAAAVAADPAVAPHVPPALPRGASAFGAVVSLGDGRTERVSADEAAVIAACDGQRTLDALATACGRPLPAVSTAVDDLVRRGLLTRTLHAPPHLDAEQHLIVDLRTLVPPSARAPWEAVLAELDDARQALEKAGTPAELDDATAELDRVFETATRTAATRPKDVAREGRRLAVGQAERDVELTLGPEVVDGVASSLPVVLTAAAWLAERAAHAAEQLADEVMAELRPFYGEQVPFGALCGRVTPRLDDPALLDPVVEELTRRWRDVLPVDLAASRVTLAADAVDAVAARAREAFASPPPSYLAGCHHSPDLMIAAPDVDTIRRGDAHFVLGEVHTAMVTTDSESFLRFADRPERFAATAARAYPEGRRRYVPLHVREAGRSVSGWSYPTPDAPNERHTYISFGARTGERVPDAPTLAAGDITVVRADDGLRALLPDGTSEPLVALLGEYVSYAVVQRFTLFGTVSHHPRVTLDRLTVARETWRVPATAWDDVLALSEPAAFRRVRQRAEQLGLPRHTFWRAAPGTKPVLLDLASPLLVAVLVRELGRAVAGGHQLAFQEMYPGPDDLWLADAAGARYTSELRLTAARGAL